MTERQEKYVAYMRELYPKKYAGMEYDYDRERWYTTNLSKRRWHEPKQRNKKGHPKHTPPDIRTAVLDRDGHKCMVCGGSKKLQVHHIKHREHGGTNDTDNLITLCAKCHAAEHKEEPVYNIMAKAVF